MVGLVLAECSARNLVEGSAKELQHGLHMRYIACCLLYPVHVHLYYIHVCHRILQICPFPFILYHFGQAGEVAYSWDHELPFNDRYQPMNATWAHNLCTYTCTFTGYLTKKNQCERKLMTRGTSRYIESSCSPVCGGA